MSSPADRSQLLLISDVLFAAGNVADSNGRRA